MCRIESKRAEKFCSAGGSDVLFRQRRNEAYNNTDAYSLLSLVAAPNFFYQADWSRLPAVRILRLHP